MGLTPCSVADTEVTGEIGWIVSKDGCTALSFAFTVLELCVRVM